MPTAANGSVSARKVSGGSSVTPSLSTGQLQPQISASTAIGSHARASACVAASPPRDRRVHARDGQRYGGEPYLLWCSARACTTHWSRRMRPGNSGSAAVELVDVALGPAPDLAVGRDAQLREHALEHRADADDELQVVVRARPAEQQRRRVGLDLDDERAIAGDLAARVREVGDQRAALLGEGREPRELRDRGRRAPRASAARSASSASDEPRTARRRRSRRRAARESAGRCRRGRRATASRRRPSRRPGRTRGAWARDRAPRGGRRSCRRARRRRCRSRARSATSSVRPFTRRDGSAGRGRDASGNARRIDHCSGVRATGRPGRAAEAAAARIPE